MPEDPEVDRWSEAIEREKQLHDQKIAASLAPREEVKSEAPLKFVALGRFLREPSRESHWGTW